VVDRLALRSRFRGGATSNSFAVVDGLTGVSGSAGYAAVVGGWADPPVWVVAKRLRFAGCTARLVVDSQGRPLGLSACEAVVCVAALAWLCWPSVSASKGPTSDAAIGIA